MRSLVVMLAIALGCRGAARAPTTSVVPPRLAMDARDDAAIVDVIALEPVASIESYCRGLGGSAASCEPVADAPTLALPAGWHARSFQVASRAGDPRCDAALEVGGVMYVVDDLGTTCGAPAYGGWCRGRAEVVRAGAWIGIVTTHAEINHYEDTMPGTRATEELRICREDGGLACSAAIAIGRLSCHGYGDGPPGGDGLVVDSAESRLNVAIRGDTLTLTWAPGPRDDLLAPGTFALQR